MQDKDAGPYKDLSELSLPPVVDYLKPISHEELMVLDKNDVSQELPQQQQYVLQNEVDQYNQTVGQETETVVDVDEATGETTTVTTVQKPNEVVPGDYRTRKITYSGWGAAGFPNTVVPDEYVEEYPDQQKQRYYQAPEQITIPAVELPDGVTLNDSATIPERILSDLKNPEDDSPLPTVLLAPGTRTMAIDGRKFNPTDENHPQMLWWTAEEWMLTNNSVALWHDPNEKPILFTGANIPTTDNLSEIYDILNTLDEAIAKAPGRLDLQEAKALYNSLVPETIGNRNQDEGSFDYKYDYPTYWAKPNAHPMTRAEGEKQNYAISTNAADHPFHMHQNPFWVMRIDVPDENGNLVNILDQPRWQDTIWIPRNGGRVIFRSRFPDYLGMYVQHCHLLLHEDNGMMQAVETVPTANSANYRPAEQVLYPGITDEEVNELYPTDSQNLERAWEDSIQFIDPDPNTGQVYPGFTATAPTPPA